MKKAITPLLCSIYITSAALVLVHGTVSCISNHRRMYTHVLALVRSSKMSTLMNYMVYCNLQKKTLLPWKIVSVHPPSHTYRSYFESEVVQQCPPGCLFSQVYVGKSKEAIDQVDPSLIISDVTGVFGNFVKFTTDSVSQQAEVVKVGICMVALSCLDAYLFLFPQTHTYRGGMLLKS